jgi:hypothetical protein
MREGLADQRCDFEGVGGDLARRAERQHRLGARVGFDIEQIRNRHAAALYCFDQMILRYALGRRAGHLPSVARSSDANGADVAVGKIQFFARIRAGQTAQGERGDQLRARLKLALHRLRDDIRRLEQLLRGGVAIRLASAQQRDRDDGDRRDRHQQDERNEIRSKRGALYVLPVLQTLLGHRNLVPETL